MARPDVRGRAPATLRALEEQLAARLAALEACGPGCRSCRDAEARAFLARLRPLPLRRQAAEGAVPLPSVRANATLPRWEVHKDG